jgi:hypothetical protein
LASGVSSAVPGDGGQVTVTLAFGTPVDIFNLFTLNITLSDFSADQFSLDVVTIE